MPNIEFIMTRQDSIELGTYLLAEFNAHVAIDDSSTEIPQTLTSVQEIADYITSREACPLLFVTSAQWGGHRLCTKNIVKDDKSYYYIWQRYGSPSFTWMVPKLLIKNGITHLIQGFIGDYPWYYDSLGRPETTDRPPSMADAYNKIFKFVRSHSIRSVWVNSNKKGPWVGKRCLELISKGAKLGGDGQWSVNV
jgi:hypothetical protein